jgi:hypothetical protein
MEDLKLPQKIRNLQQKIEKFCGTFGFSAENLDFLQKIENFCGKSETSIEDPNLPSKIQKFRRT